MNTILDGIHAKIMDFSAIAAWRETLRRNNVPVVYTNGCFDIIHSGHVAYLATARALGGVLAIGLNSDSSVRALKGESRPIVPEADRALTLASMGFVDAVTVFDGARCDGLIRVLRPDIYVKGGDYVVDSLDRGERAALEDVGAAIRFIPFVEGRSTSGIIRKIKET